MAKVLLVRKVVCELGIIRVVYESKAMEVAYKLRCNGNTHIEGNAMFVHKNLT